MDDKWKKSGRCLYSQREGLQGHTTIQTNFTAQYGREDVFLCLASILIKYMLDNHYVKTSVQKVGVPGVPGYIEHTAMVWEAIRRAKRSRFSHYIVCIVFGKCLRISSSPTPLENIRDASYSNSLHRVPNSILDEGFPNIVDSTPGRDCHGMRNLSISLRHGYANLPQRRLVISFRGIHWKSFGRAEQQEVQAWACSICT